jgi:hypothetical protein
MLSIFSFDSRSRVGHKNGLPARALPRKFRSSHREG